MPFIPLNYNKNWIFMDCLNSQLRERNNTASNILKSLIVMLSMMLVSCKYSNRDVTIINSKYFHLDAEANVNSQDPMVRFEKKHLLYGAITQQEKKLRSGHYYIFDWLNPNWKNPNESITVRFEYRQKQTGSKTHRKDFKPSRSQSLKNKTKIKITGREYLQNGKVTAWRFSIIRGNSVIASDQSYLW